MRILSRYLGMVVFRHTLMVLVVLLAILTLFQVVDDVDDVGKGRFGLMQLGLYVVLLLPHDAYRMLPVATLIGALIGLGGLARDNELVAIRASGVSVAGIVGLVLRAGLVLFVLAVVIGEGVAPASQRYAQQVRAYAVSGGLAVRAGTGYWVRDGKRFVHIGKVLPDSSLREVSIYTFDGPQLTSAAQAQTARYADGQWIFTQLRESHISDQAVEASKVGDAAWGSDVDPGLLQILVTRPDFLTAPAQWEYIRYLEENGLDASAYKLALWRRIFLPLDLLVMLVLAVPLVMGSIRSGGIGQRIVLGVLIGVVYTLLSETFGQLGVVYHLNPLFAAGFPTLIFLLATVYAVRRHV